MKKLLLIVSLFAVTAFSQYRDNGFPTATVKDGIVDNSGTSLFGFMNSDKFQMKHSYSLSYSSFGSNGLALGVYTNSIFFKFNEDLNMQVDASVVHSPYSTFGKDFQNNINGIYRSRASLNYRPWKDVQINLQYRSLPAYYNNGYGNSFYNGFYNGYERNPFWGF